jgi:hypothetical protein
MRPESLIHRYDPVLSKNWTNHQKGNKTENIGLLSRNNAPGYPPQLWATPFFV